MNSLSCVLMLATVVILGAILSLVIEYKLEPMHRRREARRWEQRTLQLARDDALAMGRQLIQAQDVGSLDQYTLARDCLRAMCERERART